MLPVPPTPLLTLEERDGAGQVNWQWRDAWWQRQDCCCRWERERECCSLYRKRKLKHKIAKLQQQQHQATTKAASASVAAAPTTTTTTTVTTTTSRISMPKELQKATEISLFNVEIVYIIFGFAYIIHILNEHSPFPLSPLPPLSHSLVASHVCCMLQLSIKKRAQRSTTRYSIKLQLKAFYSLSRWLINRYSNFSIRLINV